MQNAIVSDIQAEYSVNQLLMSASIPSALLRVPPLREPPHKVGSAYFVRFREQCPLPRLSNILSVDEGSGIVIAADQAATSQRGRAQPAIAFDFA